MKKKIKTKYDLWYWILLLIFILGLALLIKILITGEIE